MQALRPMFVSFLVHFIKFWFVFLYSELFVYCFVSRSISLFSINSEICQVVKATASGAVVTFLITSQVKPMILKLVFTASLLNAQQ